MFELENPRMNANERSPQMNTNEREIICVFSFVFIRVHSRIIHE